jgi:hypothetical protein
LGDLSSSYGYADIAPGVSIDDEPICTPDNPPDANAYAVAQRIPVADDTDSLTKATIGKMCEYINSSASDPHVIGAAQYAARGFGRGQSDPYSNAWGVFWFLKHRIRRVLDEGNMFRVGEPGAFDMLIAPSVLLRMSNPAEDCDGFTMSAAAMLKALSVPQCLVSVACDPREPQRWSHVFGMVQLANGDWMPLDCSHGPQPGWMVPQNRISRWQAWDLDGNPIDVQMPVQSGLRGYTRRGVGQDDLSIPVPVNSTPFDWSDILGGLENNDPTGGVPASSLPGLLSGVSTSSPSTSSQINWGSLFGSLASDATRVASIAELPAGDTLNANGTVSASLQSALSTMMPLILLGLGAFLVISLVENAGHR